MADKQELVSLEQDFRAHASIAGVSEKVANSQISLLKESGVDMEQLVPKSYPAHHYQK